MRKRVFYTELAYVFGIVILALGTAFMERADLGVSMVVAPAYLVHRKLSQILPVFSFGMAEYCLQAVLLVAMVIVLRRFKIGYLFSFVTAVFYGIVLDLMMLLVKGLPLAGMALHLVNYVVGLLLCSLGVALLFHTYIAPEAYELFVKEISAKYHTDISRTKTIYDCTSCLVGILLSFAFFGWGHFEGVKAGTVFCALVNGWIIGWMSRGMERCFEFRDAFRTRK